MAVSYKDPENWLHTQRVSPRSVKLCTDSRPATDHCSITHTPKSLRNLLFHKHF